MVPFSRSRGPGKAIKYSYDELIGMVDHSLLHPAMTDEELRRGCEVARKYRVASVCIKPWAVRMAAELLAGSGVAAGADFVKTSTGYGFVKGADGTYSYRGATEADLRLMRRGVPAARRHMTLSGRQAGASELARRRGAR